MLCPQSLYSCLECLASSMRYRYCLTWFRAMCHPDLVWLLGALYWVVSCVFLTCACCALAFIGALLCCPRPLFPPRVLVLWYECVVLHMGCFIVLSVSLSVCPRLMLVLAWLCQECPIWVLKSSIRRGIVKYVFF